MRARLAALGVGIWFGVVLSWSGMSSPTVIRGALLFQHAYLFLFFASAVVTAAIGVALLGRVQKQALLVPAPIEWARERIERRHVVGSVIFGLGWGIADACPGPIVTQLGQGILYAVPLMAGVVVGVHVYLRRHVTETEPALERPARAARATPSAG